MQVPDNDLPEDVVSIAKASELCHVHWSTVKSLAEKGHIRSWARIASSVVLVSLSEVQNMLKWELRGNHAEAMDTQS